MKLPENIKIKHIILLTGISVIGISFLVKIIKEKVKSGASNNSYDNAAVNLANQLSNALYPDGRPKKDKAGFIERQIPGLSWLKKSVYYFDASPDVDKIFQIAGGHLNPDNFKSVSKAYHKLYGSDLLFDLESRLGDKYNDFDYKMRSGNLMNNPDTNSRIVQTLALNIFDDLNDWWGLADREYYEQLNQMDDKNLESVYYEFEEILRSKSKEGTLKTYLKKIYTVGRADDIIQRLNILGLR